MCYKTGQFYLLLTGLATRPDTAGGKWTVGVEIYCFFNTIGD